MLCFLRQLIDTTISVRSSRSENWAQTLGITKAVEGGKWSKDPDSNTSFKRNYPAGKEKCHLIEKQCLEIKLHIAAGNLDPFAVKRKEPLAANSSSSTICLIHSTTKAKQYAGFQKEKQIQ